MTRKIPGPAMLENLPARSTIARSQALAICSPSSTSTARTTAVIVIHRSPRMLPSGIPIARMTTARVVAIGLSRSLFRPAVEVRLLACNGVVGCMLVGPFTLHGCEGYGEFGRSKSKRARFTERASCDVTESGGSEIRIRSRLRVGDERTAPARGCYHAVALKVDVGAIDRVGIHAQMDGDLPNRRQLNAGREPPRRKRPKHLLAKLNVYRQRAGRV